MVPKVSPHPIPELEEFLRPFCQHFYRVESPHTLERFATGLLAKVEHKSGAGIVRDVAGLSESALYRLMTETEWDEAALNNHRVRLMVEKAVAGEGVLVVDDTSYPRRGLPANTAVPWARWPAHLW